MVILQKLKQMCTAQYGYSLYEVLKGHVLHCTSAAAFKSICEDGFIRVNDDSFPYTWKQTRGSCIHQLGGISLLDFGLPENKIFFETEQENFRYPWEDILTAHEPITIVIEINRDKVLNKTISWEQIRAKTEKCLLVPFVEVCCFEPIPIDFFEGLVAVRTLSEFLELSKGICSDEILNIINQV